MHKSWVKYWCDACGKEMKTFVLEKSTGKEAREYGVFEIGSKNFVLNKDGSKSNVTHPQLDIKQYEFCKDCSEKIHKEVLKIVKVKK